MAPKKPSEVEVLFDDGTKEWVPIDVAEKQFGYKWNPPADPGVINGALTTALNSALFNAGDDIISYFDPATGQQIRDDIDAYRAHHETGAKVANVGGAIAGTLAPGRLVAGGMAKAPALVKALSRYFGASGTVGRMAAGGAEAVLQNVADHRPDKGSLKADALLGTLAPGVSYMVGKGVKNVAGLGEVPGVTDTRSSQWLREGVDSGRFTADDLDEAAGLITRSKEYGKPLSLIESVQKQTSPTETMFKDRLFNKLKMVGQSNDASNRIINEFAGDRQVKDAIRVSNDLNLIHDVGKVMSDEDIGRALKTALDAPGEATSHLYKEAYKAAPKLSSENSDRLLQLYDIDTDIKNAINSAIKKLGEDPKNVGKTFDIDSSEVVHRAKGMLYEAAEKLPITAKRSIRELKNKWAKLRPLLPEGVQKADEAFSKVAKTSDPRRLLGEIVYKSDDNRQLVKQLIGSPKKRGILTEAMSEEKYRELVDRLGIENRIFQGNQYFNSNSDTARNIKSLSDLFFNRESGLDFKQRAGEYLMKFRPDVDDEFAVDVTQKLLSTGDDALKELDNLNKYIEATELGRKYDKGSRDLARALLRGF